MGKCRDCIHHDVCKDFIDTTFDGFLDDGDELPYDDNDMNGEVDLYPAQMKLRFEKERESNGQSQN